MAHRRAAKKVVESLEHDLNPDPHPQRQQPRPTAAAEENPEQRRDELIEQAASAAPDMADLIRLYYRYIPPEEVTDTDPVDLVGIVRSAP